jgi:hypothetical protein
MHASLWRFSGDPDDLLRRYDAMVAEIPIASMRLHVCLGTKDGIVVVDTCPSAAAYQAFSSGPFHVLRANHGLPHPKYLEDYPVHAAFINGHRAVKSPVRSPLSPHNDRAVAALATTDLQNVETAYRAECGVTDQSV